MTNLKQLSALLGVSTDYLLENGEAGVLNVIREPVDLAPYGKGLKKKRKDRLMRDRFPTETIITLIPEQVETRGEKVVDNLLGFLTDAPFGIPAFLNGLKLLDREFYLVIAPQGQYLVTVGDEVMETRRMAQPMEDRRGARFQVGDLIFTHCGPIVYG